MKVKLQINQYNFTATLESNQATKELMDILDKGRLILDLEDYSGFEKVGPLGFSLSTSDRNITTKSGDIVLYNGNQIVIFYGSNTWSYTKIGKIDDLTEWGKALGKAKVTIKLEKII